MGQIYRSDTRHKGSQWGFTMLPNANIDHLANLPPEDVLYVTFAMLDNNTGKQYLQGFVRKNVASVSVYWKD